MGRNGNGGLTFDELLKEIERLPYTQFRRAVEHYSAAHTLDFGSEWNRTVYQNFEQRLEALKINTACPHCGSVAVGGHGERNGIRRFLCADCHKTFTRFTGTILEKSRWHWDVWVTVLEMTLNDYSLETMKRVLEIDLDCGGINIKTLHAWRLKLIHAMASMPQPILHGVVQMDETHLRESQKAARGELVSYVKGEEWLPRYGRQPSKYGVMGPEFSTVMTAIDSSGYCVCYVAALGKAQTDHIIDLFAPHLDCPAFLCSDGNSTYADFCDAYEIPHYIRPSNYNMMIEKAGYAASQDETLRAHNRAILERLYREGVIDRLNHREDLTYSEFDKLKRSCGLSLARVNELHKDIKLLIEKQMTNVSTKYLADYIGFFSYRRNWRVSRGHYPNANKDAEDIFVELLQQKVNLPDIDEIIVELITADRHYMISDEDVKFIQSQKYRQQEDE